MSNALAVATVTQALALLIEHNLHPEIDMAVSVETRKPPSDPPTDPTITVFLYQVTHNPSMRNNDLVTRASDGTLLKRPAAAIDLHFVISAYGEETELVGQRLIGSVVRTLHEIPVLPRELIEEAAQRPYLEGSDLADSLQKVRFTPTQMDIDETSKLWGMLNNTPYSLSVVYQASLVLLDGHQKPVPAKPVQRAEVKVLPFGAPGAPERPVVGSGGADAADSGGVGPVEKAAVEKAAVGTGAGTAEAVEVGTAGVAGATGAAGATDAKASGGGARAAKKVAGGASAGRGSGKSSGTSARSRTRKATGGAARDGGRTGTGHGGGGGTDGGPSGADGGADGKADSARPGDGKQS
ncbi:DUF4255 domain-containing protein [Streptomyces inhibens]|uniref:DUF4255 domain-containing protein n=1 Tax=Streptomyces inhibens TaxID=2293571 RepID=A0A371PZW8_STRIH|nr:DUF4255 domain-containing protein [Streptomyces inhibens]REK87653.1 DUF4255 domain-containing protein [Streptomyces inhibens]